MRVNALSQSNATHRRGIALVAALAALSAVGTLAAMILWKEAAARRLIDRHEASVQADHLATGALELAIARLLDARPKERLEWRFGPEELLPGATATVEVRPSTESPGQFQVRSSVLYNPDGRVTFNRSAEAAVRFEEKDGRTVAERVLPGLPGEK